MKLSRIITIILKSSFPAKPQCFIFNHPEGNKHEIQTSCQRLSAWSVEHQPLCLWRHGVRSLLLFASSKRRRIACSVPVLNLPSVYIKSWGHSAPRPSPSCPFSQGIVLIRVKCAQRELSPFPATEIVRMRWKFGHLAEIRKNTLFRRKINMYIALWATDLAARNLFVSCTKKNLNSSLFHHVLFSIWSWTLLILKRVISK